ncbi:MAG: GFA family protein [Caldimonas sp.]
MSEDTPTAMTGGCLCGAVRFEARLDKPEGYYCHCRMCQLAFGNTRAAFVNLRKDAVTWTATAPARFASSKLALRGFCATCGTPLSFEYLASDRMDLAAGAFDDPAALRPVAHFAVESRIASWHAADGLPEERLDQNARIAERWRDAYGSDVVPGLAAARED